MASTQLQRTSGTSTENYKYTFSAWVKRTGVLGSSSVNEVLFSNWTDNNNSAYIRFEDGDDNLQVFDKYGSTIDLNYQTNMKFRDPSSFYHIVVNVDSTRSANQRCKIYVNGSQVSCSNTTDTGGTLAMKTVTTTNATRLGAIRTSSGAEYYFSGIMSHIHYIDGTGYDASYFGETDATTGEWKIKTNPSVTYGNNGFFVLKDGNSVTDQSGNSNNFTVTAGTLTKTEDCPSNVFATLNNLNPNTNSEHSFSNGNTVFTNFSDGNHVMTCSNLAASSGKFYAEVKVTALGGTYPQIGVINPNLFLFNTYFGAAGRGYGFLSNGQKQFNNSASSYGNSYTTGDIICIAMDLDNHKLYFRKNDNAWENSGNPESGSTGTGSAFDLATGTFYSFGQSAYDSGTNPVYSWNFGNGYFGTTAVSSAGTNASNIGIFEYDVPTGYTALSTKGLNL
tara:strand:+ start:114 stop:1460 length:1347 start_codon:yes stop_codon:yes gene_type:complete